MSLGIPPEIPKGPNLPLFRNLFCGLAGPRAVAEQWQSRSGCFLFLGIPKVPGGGFGSRVGCLGYGPMLEAWALEQNHKKTDFSKLSSYTHCAVVSVLGSLFSKSDARLWPYFGPEMWSQKWSSCQPVSLRKHQKENQI